ncbi:MAG: hypothetical protein N3E49_07180 [Bacteroidia bacterium]|nr:hypothetical protein [Bacteroidia bacterium]
MVRSGEYVWVFSYDRRTAIGDTHVRGHLFRFRGSQAVPFLWEVTPAPGLWRPFGLACRDSFIWFAHGAGERPTEVWRFQWSGEQLESPKVWRHPAFVSLQAIQPTHNHRFYVANDRKGSARWHLVAGFFIRRVRSSLFLCEDDTCRKVGDRIPYAAGLAYLPQERTLVVSVAFRKALWIYQEVGEPVQLQYIRKVRLPGHPDNLTLVSDSVLWVVCHRRLMAWARSLAFGGHRSRWLIAEVRLLPNGQYAVRSLYKAPRGYATASMALPIGEYIYVGSVFEPTLLRLTAKGTIPDDALPTSIKSFLEPTQP